jgi:hypothetical protein
VSFALTGPAAAAFGAGAVLMFAGVVGGVVIIGLLYVIPGLRAEDGGIARAEAQAAAVMAAAPAGPQPPASDARSSANVG